MIVKRLHVRIATSNSVQLSITFFLEGISHTIYNDTIIIYFLSSEEKKENFVVGKLSKFKFDFFNQHENNHIIYHLMKFLKSKTYA